MRIAVVSHYFWPEPGAPSARLLEMSREWVSRGHEVTVVTNFPNHPTGIVPDAYRGRRFQVEHAHGLRIVRCTTYATPNRGFAKRTLGHLVFTLRAIWQATPELRGSDVLIASSPTLFSVVAALAISRRIRAPYVFEVRDLWPAIFVELGVIRNRLAIRVLEWLELTLYRRACAVVTVTRAFADDIARRGIDRGKLHVIPNGVDLDAFRPEPAEPALRARLGLTDKLVVLYCGAHGISHALSRILEVAARTQSDPRIHFLFVGEGAEKEALEARARALALGNVTFHPAVPREQVPALYRAADVCLVPLRAVALFQSFIPSKMFEILACGRPVLASLEGEAAEILRASGAAVVVGPEDVEALAAAVSQLAADPGLRSALGAADARTSRSTTTAACWPRATSSCSKARFERRRAGPYNPSLLRGPCVAEKFPLKILHVVGARPNFMKVAPVMRAMTARGDRFVQRLVHTGQHYDAAMSQVFFDELGIAPPDDNLEVGSKSHAAQSAEIMLRFEPVIEAFRPDWLMVVGDVNSTMATTLVASKLGVKTAHVEAGLRSFDRSMPEEINRLVTDALADLLLTPSQDADENLRREGVPAERIRQVGNVMIDTLLANLERARGAHAPRRIGVEPRRYVYVTLHRPSNVDERTSLEAIVACLLEVSRRAQVVFPVHPRTHQRLTDFGLLERLTAEAAVKLVEPVGYLDSIGLVEAAGCVLTDSGGLQEETTYLRVPCLTLRPNTERPITISEGSNRLTTLARLRSDLDAALTLRESGASLPCPVLWDGKASERIADALLDR